MKDIPQNERRGRAATQNETNRFEAAKREGFDDGWDIIEESSPINTEYLIDKSKSILSYNRSPDVPFDRSINPYRGCEHGCIYCFARPTHAYLGFSPGLDFESRILYKPNAVELLREALAQKSYIPSPIAFGTNTDPYQPAEKKLQIMRELLIFLFEVRHPITIVTKGSLILRDLDILGAMAKENLVEVGISVTTLNHALHRQMEPRAASPKKRLQLISALSDVGVPVTCMAAPMIPKLNDHELEAIMQAALQAGAVDAHYIFVRLPLEVSPLFRAWLLEHYPDRAGKVMAHIREGKEGKDNQSEYGKRMRGSGVYADLLNRRYQVARKKCGFPIRRSLLRTDLFRRPSLDARQLSLF